MHLDDVKKHGVGIALNEASLLGVELDPHRRIAAATFSVFTLPEQGNPPEDPRIQMILSPVGRLVASLRMGRWDDENAAVVPFSIEELLDRVRSFGGQPVYGWEFVDVDKKDFARWKDRLSLDFRSPPGGDAHTLTLFQEGANQHLDLCIWFDEIQILNPSGEGIALDRFISAGQRFWDALDAGDPRTTSSGIVPVRGE